MAADRKPSDVREPKADFSDPHSQDVLSATARRLARELGAQTYRDLTRATAGKDVDGR